MTKKKQLLNHIQIHYGSDRHRSEKKGEKNVTKIFKRETGKPFRDIHSTSTYSHQCQEDLDKPRMDMFTGNLAVREFDSF